MAGDAFTPGTLSLAVIANSAIMTLSHKHRRTLEAIFADPVQGNLEWRRIEALLLALGASRTERRGSAVSFVLNDRRVDFHRPHPGKEALRYRVKDTRRFLLLAGIAP